MSRAQGGCERACVAGGARSGDGLGAVEVRSFAVGCVIQLDCEARLDALAQRWVVGTLERLLPPLTDMNACAWIGVEEDLIRQPGILLRDSLFERDRRTNVRAGMAEEYPRQIASPPRHSLHQRRACQRQNEPHAPAGHVPV